MLSFAEEDYLGTDEQTQVKIRDCQYIPQGFPDLLEVLSREVLRAQPVNIVQFIASLLSKLVDLRNGKRESASDLTPMELPIPQSLFPKSLGL